MRTETYCEFPSSDKILRFANDPDQTSNDSMSDPQGSNFFNKSLGKNNKKGRKSPGPDEPEASPVTNKTDGVRSPAYSDISDDSNTATENGKTSKNLFCHLLNLIPQINLRSMQI